MSISFVRIKKGEYRNQPIVNEIFPLVKHYQLGAKGGFVTVDATHKLGESKNIRVKVSDVSSFEFVSQQEFITNEGVDIEEVTEEQYESDEEIIARIKGRFEILDDMTKAAINGGIRAMIVSGPPGVGKSFGVERELDKIIAFNHLASSASRAEVIKGATTALGLYCTLYKFSDPKSILVFDDCDSVLLDDVCLNLLKGALDTGKKRKISWLSDSNALRREDIPDSFEFKGSIIFITNIKFDSIRSPKIKDHLDALQSRCHYLDLTLDTERDKILRIKQIARDGDLFSNYNFAQHEEQEIVDFMTDNKDMLRELSLRMAIKIADLRKQFPNKWIQMAESTVMRRA